MVSLGFYLVFFWIVFVFLVFNVLLFFFLLFRKMGINEFDNLFLGMMNLDFFENMEIFGLFVDVVDGVVMVVWLVVCLIFVFILVFK